ncbi:phage tail tape measure protein [Altererythrobacter sp. CC-YST694]|uniref:phage tail tape measure protein n=1 Tax=Altererythrobacter sp. CC-YST694 TaxID=2755038 RepID=UPI001D0026A4|nr:phage tail tape measure protein [Altererythrobacter sp. CC-YST694]MCB5423945.1 phage tail tape measure protein [Altererythrobacter sp. CC-YST694]
MNKNLRLLVSFASSDRLSGPLKNIVGLGQSGSEQLAAMKREARDLEKEMRNVQGELKRSTGNVSALMNRERDLAERIARTNSEMERQTKLLAINARADAMRNRGADLRSAGTENIVTGVAMAAPAVLASKQAMTFESAMADVRKVVDFDTPRQFQQMGDDLLDLSTRIPMTAEGMAQIVAAAGRAGVARKELLTFTEDAAQMGIAFDTTAEDAGGMMAKWRTAFGMGQKDVRTLADQINALTNTYGGNVGAVAGITTRIGALGKVAGLAAPQIAAMGQLMNSVGVEEEIAATGIKNMMLAMTKGDKATKSQQQAMEALGLDARDMAAAMQKDAGGAILGLLEKLRQLPKEAQAGTLTQLFGSESVAAIAPMLTNLDQLKKNFALVGDSTAYAGSMQKEYLARIATTEGALGLAKNGLSAVNITLGQALLPTITEGAQKVVAIANSVRAWTKEHPDLAKGLMLTATGIAGVTLGLGALKLGIGFAIGPLVTLWKAWKQFQMLKEAGTFVSAFGKIRGAALMLGQGFVRLAAMMSVTPLALGGIVLAVVVVGYLIWRYWDNIKAAFNSGLAMLSGAWNWLKSTFMRFPYLFGPIGVAVAFVIRHWDGIKSAFGAGLDFLAGLPGKMLGLGKQIMAGLLNGLDPLGLRHRLLDIAKSGLTAFKNFFGIKSPSRLMMLQGSFITQGLASGIERGGDGPVQASRAMAGDVAMAAMRPRNLPLALSPMRGAAPAAANNNFTFGPGAITIKAAPGQSAANIADEVVAEFRRLADGKAAAKRSSFSDQ